MRFLSVCSGIEAASTAWNSLGWRAVAFSEIDPFASAVLAERHPDVPNWGDMTRYEEWPDIEFDLLVGGTPCQDLSVAGKRAGLDGERSGLFHDFVAIAKKYKPQYIVWENVPGALSTNEGKDIQTVIDSFTQIGYACDIDILDAQCFGLAQRRRRVFVVCVKLEGLLKQKTPTSARIAAELLLQPLADTWAAILQAWCPDKTLSSYEHPIEKSEDFARRRIELLEAALDGSACTKFLNALGASQALSTAEQLLLGSTSHQQRGTQAGVLKMGTGGYPSWSTGGGSGGKSTATSWNNILAALSEQEKKSTTKIWTDQTTASVICTFADQTLTIVQSITGLRSCSDQETWSADYWHLASLVLTTLEAVTIYARHTTEDLFGDHSLRDNWRNNLDAARKLACDTQRRLGAQRGSGPVFSVPHSLSGNPAPRREAGKATAPTLAARTRGGGGLGTDFDCDGGLIAFGGNNTTGPIDVATACRAKGGSGHGDFESETFVAQEVAFKASHFTRGKDGAPSPVAPALSADADKGDQDTLILAFDETQITNAENRCNPQPGDPSHPLAKGARPPTICFSAKDHGADAMTEVSPTLRAGGFDKSHANAGVMPAIAFDCKAGANTGFAIGDVMTSLRGEGHGGGHAATLHNWRVRRLTPLECARLQGFSDEYLDITYRRKPAADGPKYKALGNSMAVNCMRWIGQRIELVAAL